MIDTVFILKFLKFCAVGFCGMGIDFGSTWLLREKAKINSYVANSCGFIIAASCNYLLNRWWTFASNNPQIAREYFSFFAISLFGLGLNNLTIWVLSKKYNLNFYFSKLLAIGLVTIWNFCMNLFFTFV
ncbi:MAG: GtrA family protein [Dysgonamonadaceae bacterium]|jgi:putative flippase GtrA|nr:GtrA family protein [Dysgonamonadaceae bacterium]